MNGGNGSKFWGTVLTLGLTGGAMVFLFGTMEESRGMPSPAMPVFAALAAAAIFGTLIRGPIGKAIGKMLEGNTAPDDQLVMRVEQLEDRLSELGMDQLRVAELEERLDFAERLLSQRETAGALKRPES